MEPEPEEPGVFEFDPELEEPGALEFEFEEPGAFEFEFEEPGALEFEFEDPGALEFDPELEPGEVVLITVLALPEPPGVFPLEVLPGELPEEEPV